jgi:hypothetical protein
MKAWGSCALLVLLFGCAGNPQRILIRPTVWVKPGATQAELDFDTWQCGIQAGGYPDLTFCMWTKGWSARFPVLRVSAR